MPSIFAHDARLRALLGSPDPENEGSSMELADETSPAPAVLFHAVVGVPAEIYGRFVLLFAEPLAGEEPDEPVVLPHYKLSGEHRASSHTRTPLAQWLSAEVEKISSEMVHYSFQKTCKKCGRALRHNHCTGCLLPRIAKEQEALVEQTDLDQGDLEALLEEAGVDLPDATGTVLERLQAAPHWLRQAGVWYAANPVKSSPEVVSSSPSESIEAMLERLRTLR